MSENGFLRSRPVQAVRDGVEVLQAVLFLLALASGLLGVSVTVLDGIDWWPDSTAAMLVPTVTALVLVVSLLLLRTIVDGSSDFRIEELEGTLRVAATADHHTYTYTRKQTVRSNRDGLRLVAIRSHWSGQSRQRPHTSSLFPEHTLLDGGIPEEDGRIYRWIYLLGPIAKNQRVEVGLRHVFHDDFSTMKPYYRESGEERRVRKIRVTAVFDRGLAPTRVEGVVWRRTSKGYGRQDSGKVACHRSVDRANDLVKYVVSVDRPRRGCAYGLRWQWPETAEGPLGAVSAVPAHGPDDRSGSYGGG
ncbi:hypothetical protein ACI2K4_03845 [Micromonospora sp. NPDC050397]|uniref:hypothetical protein n=1 Tax=Micromonospora sp. NPDC050397 TaxID=3364279 RepID=UPI00384F4BF1